MSAPRSPTEIFQAAADHYNAQDMDAFRALLHPEVTFTPDPSWPEAGPYRGREEVVAFMREFAAPFARVTLAVDDLTQVGGHAVARCRWVVEGAASGIATDVAFTFVGTVRDGRIDGFRAFFDHDEALASIS